MFLTDSINPPVMEFLTTLPIQCQWATVGLLLYVSEVDDMINSIFFKPAMIYGMLSEHMEIGKWRQKREKGRKGGYLALPKPSLIYLWI